MTQLGKYQLHEELGRGGYGTVYRAYDTVLKVERAVKVLHPALVADPEFIERFKREAQLAAQLEHPHIVPVYDLGDDQGRFFLVMKYMPGRSLKDLLVIDGCLDLAHALQINHQIAGALDFAHQRDFVHRDVKPGNILFDQDGSARIADFGFAKALSGANSVSVTASGGIVGTPSYIAPEIWRARGASPATDIYSLACVFYEMLVGRVLFDGDSPADIMTKHVLDNPQFPNVWPNGVSEELASLLETALSKNEADRYKSTLRFSQACSSLLHEQPKLTAENDTTKVASQVQNSHHDVDISKFKTIKSIEKPDPSLPDPAIDQQKRISSDANELKNFDKRAKGALSQISVSSIIAIGWIFVGLLAWWIALVQPIMTNVQYFLLVLISGIFGGLVNAWILKKFELELNWKQIIIIAIEWGLGVLIIELIHRASSYRVVVGVITLGTMVMNIVLGSIVTGFVVGILTGIQLRKSVDQLAWRNIIRIAFACSSGAALGWLTQVTTIIDRAVMHTISINFSPELIISIGIFAFIGGWVTVNNIRNPG
jgi:serine/threonine protein kinase